MSQHEAKVVAGLLDGKEDTPDYITRSGVFFSAPKDQASYAIKKEASRALT